MSSSWRGNHRHFHCGRSKEAREWRVKRGDGWTNLPGLLCFSNRRSSDLSPRPASLEEPSIFYFDNFNSINFLLSRRAFGGDSGASGMASVGRSRNLRNLRSTPSAAALAALSETLNTKFTHHGVEIASFECRMVFQRVLPPRDDLTDSTQNPAQPRRPKVIPNGEDLTRTLRAG